jgi:hypothetical protein
VLPPNASYPFAVLHFFHGSSGILNVVGSALV